MGYVVDAPLNPNKQTSGSGRTPGQMTSMASGNLGRLGVFPLNSGGYLNFLSWTKRTKFLSWANSASGPCQFLTVETSLFELEKYWAIAVR